MKYTVEESLASLREFIRSGRPLKELSDVHGISSKREKDLLILNYDQISVNWNEPYGYAARGLILDANTLDVACFGLSKFFNHGEPFAHTLDWSQAFVFEKIDGTMVNRWWNPHENKFCLTTRYQMPGDVATNKISSAGATWGDMFEKAFADVQLTQPKDETWVFEACSPLNMVVVQHTSFYVKLLAIRNIETLKERPVLGYDLAPQMHVLANAEEIQAYANTFRGTQLEGFVVFDGVNRVKIKSEEYVQLHRMQNSLTSPKGLLGLVQGRDYEEVLAVFPHFRETVETVVCTVNDIIRTHEEAYDNYQHIDSQKDFAIGIRNLGLRYPAALFNVRSGKARTIQDAFYSLDESAFVKVFKEQVQYQLFGE